MAKKIQSVAVSLNTVIGIINEMKGKHIPVVMEKLESENRPTTVQRMEFLTKFEQSVCSNKLTFLHRKGFVSMKPRGKFHEYFISEDNENNLKAFDAAVKQLDQISKGYVESISPTA